MRRVFFIISVLVLCVFTTACINNFAIKELNTNAKKYMNNGDIDSAICRLKSSLELDNQVWETHYNLAIAYLTAEKYEEAQKEFQETLALNAELADAYYSLAVCFERQADSMLKNQEVQEEVVEESQDEVVDVTVEEEKPLDDEAKAFIVSNLNEAITNYAKFIAKTQKQEDIVRVEAKIKALENEIKELQEAPLE